MIFPKHARATAEFSERRLSSCEETLFKQGSEAALKSLQLTVHSSLQFKVFCKSVVHLPAVSQSKSIVNCPLSRVYSKRTKNAGPAHHHPHACPGTRNMAPRCHVKMLGHDEIATTLRPGSTLQRLQKPAIQRAMGMTGIWSCIQDC